MSPDERRNYQPQSVRKALAILACFDRQRSELSVAELCDRLGMRASSLYRYLAVLEEEQLIQRVPGKARFALGLRMIELGGLALGRLEVRRHGQGELDQLADSVGLNANLAVLHQGDVMHLAYAVRTDVDRMYAVIGRRSPAHCTALGKTLLAYVADDEVRRGIERYGWRPCTDASIRTFDQLFADLARIRTNGFALDRGEAAVGTACVAAPVRDEAGQVCAAISVSGRFHALRDDLLDRAVSEVRHRAESLSLRLGYSGRPSDLEPGA